ncbi:MAG: hypothetical protein AABX03_00550 [Nanoarchaeota archaeon]
MSEEISGHYDYIVTIWDRVITGRDLSPPEPLIFEKDIRAIKRPYQLEVDSED